MTYDRFKVLARLYVDLYAPYKLQSAFLVALGFLNGILGSVGLLALIPLLSFAIKEEVAEQSGVSQLFVSAFSYLGLDLNVKSLLILIVLIFALKAVALYFFNYLGAVISANIANGLRRDFFSKALSSGWDYLVHQKIGYLEYALMNDMAITMSLLNRMYDALMSFSSFMVYIVTAFVLSFRVTFIALLFGAVMLFIFKLAAKTLRRYAKKSGLIKRSMSHYINESVLGLKAIKAFGEEERVGRAFYDILNASKEIGLKMVRIKSVLANPIEFISALFVVALFAFSYGRPDFSFTAFLVVVYLIHQLFIYVDKFQHTLHNINEAVPSVDRIMALERALYEHRESELGDEPFSFENELVFKKVSFAYGKNSKVLDDVDFTIEKGGFVGIVGPSGAGKTTIADLILRLFRPQEGEILLDGKNISGISLRDWRRNTGYVSQDIFLKDGTVGENIRFYGETISDGLVEEAARTANIYEFIKGLPKGFETQVGSRGLLLSGGQRQRIVLARTLARRPQILVLDEATSSLDGESETLIKEALEKLRGRITIIIIAHRLSTVANADKIIALKDGRVVEEGDPRDLLRDASSYFYKMRELADSNART